MNGPHTKHHTLMHHTMTLTSREAAAHRRPPAGWTATVRRASAAARRLEPLPRACTGRTAYPPSAAGIHRCSSLLRACNTILVCVSFPLCMQRRELPTATAHRRRAPALGRDRIASCAPESAEQLTSDGSMASDLTLRSPLADHSMSQTPTWLRPAHCWMPMLPSGERVVLPQRKVSEQKANLSRQASGRWMAKMVSTLDLDGLLQTSQCPTNDLACAAWCARV